MMAPNTQALIMEVMRSQAVIALTQELRMMTAGTSYTSSAIIILHAMPAAPKRQPWGVLLHQILLGILHM